MFNRSFLTSPRQRARGALLGLAVGDALGTTLEFSRPACRPFTERLTGPHADVTGGGPFVVARGQVTDDTQMAVCLATSLVERGRFHAEDVASRYRQWVELAFDAGALTRAALADMGSSEEPVQGAGLRVWLRGGRKSAGNGSLMRTAPIGVYFAAPAEAAARRAASLADSALTHADPRCQIACAAFNAAIASALQGAASAEAVLQAAEVEVEEAAEHLRQTQLQVRHETQSARAALLEDLAAARSADPGLYGPGLHLHEAQGFVRVAFRLAFWELTHAPSAREALLDVVNRGGDADTNGAITGALVGAFYGEDALPQPWRSLVLQALADVDQSPWWQRYHPRLLLALAERAPTAPFGGR